MGPDLDLHLVSTSVNMVLHVEDAHQVFDQRRQPNVILWIQWSQLVLKTGFAKRHCSSFEQCNVKERNQTRWQLLVFSTHAAMVTLLRKVGSTFPQSGISMTLCHHLCTIAIWSISLVVQVNCTRHILSSSICHANLMLSYVESCWVCLWDSWQCGTCKICCWACPGAITRS